MYISDNDKRTFKGILLLNDLIVNSALYGQNERNSALFKNIFDDLILQGCIEINSENGSQTGFYSATEKGKTVYDNFMIRYTEFLKFYEVFAHVDTGTGEFGLESFFEKEEQEWFDYVSDKRFEDMRIAVALFKKINPSEMIFMSFIKEGRFDDFKTALNNDAIFNEIDVIITAAIKPGGDVNDDFMKDLITKGANLIVSLLEKEKTLQDDYANQVKITLNSSTSENDGIITKTTTQTVEVDDYAYYDDPYYYESYYDPYFISPIWLVPLFLW